MLPGADTAKTPSARLFLLPGIDALAKEKHISKDVIFEAIESAVVSAYKKNFGTSHQNVRVEINQSTGEILAFMQMDVVEELEDEETQMTLEEAREIDDRYEIGDIIKDVYSAAVNVKTYIITVKLILVYHLHSPYI